MRGRFCVVVQAAGDERTSDISKINFTLELQDGGHLQGSLVGPRRRAGSVRRLWWDGLVPVRQRRRCGAKGPASARARNMLLCRGARRRLQASCGHCRRMDLHRRLGHGSCREKIAGAQRSGLELRMLRRPGLCWGARRMRCYLRPVGVRLFISSKKINF